MSERAETRHHICGERRVWLCAGMDRHDGQVCGRPWTINARLIPHRARHRRAVRLLCTRCSLRRSPIQRRHSLNSSACRQTLPAGDVRATTVARDQLRMHF
eukprot:350856-Chlamydomonas_euryale.AAC.5